MGMRLPYLAETTRHAHMMAADGSTAHYRVLCGRPPAQWLSEIESVSSGDNRAADGVPSSAAASACENTSSSSDSVSPILLSGRFHVGAQKHFYMETNAAVATPTAGGGMEVLSSTQNPMLTQSEVAAALGVSLHLVECKVMHVGGAFGGKLSGGAIEAAVVAAVAARKAGVPVRVHNERVDDMVSTGGRAPMAASFRASIMADGRIPSLEMDIVFDGGSNGYAGDAQMGLQWSDNCYKHADYDCKTSVQRSATAGDSACRAPGVISSVPYGPAP